MRCAGITGASSGIGQAAAVRIAERGVGVIVTYGNNPDGAAETVAAIERSGGDAVALPLDVGRHDTFPAFADDVATLLRDRWGRTDLDHLVNNAALLSDDFGWVTGEHLEESGGHRM